MGPAAGVVASFAVNEEARRYEILGVLGEGGFGRVYKARLVGPSGFEKSVAIKLLTDVDAPDHALKRLRDESRILGLVRDRAIVAADPPTRLHGQWAVVMEYVEGQSLDSVRKQHGAIPPRTCADIIEEIARALHTAHTAKGPDGNPLNLLHRDLKPGNIQLTPAGEVKILDFGNAKAHFAARESVTQTQERSGTIGFMAPERFDGEELPEGDVFSLGVVLKTMVTGLARKQLRSKDPIEDDDVRALWELAEQMSQDKASDRPSMREIEDRCVELQKSLGGPTLRRWAEAHCTAHEGHTQDELVGSVMTETLAVDLWDDEEPGSLQPRSVAVAATLGVGTVATIVFVVGAVVVLLVYLITVG